MESLRETILVIDDQPLVLGVVEGILQSVGHQVLMARSSEEALELCRQFDGPIHLVLMDLLMPGTDTSTLRNTLRELAPQTPVLYMSGFPQEHMQHGALAMEAKDFLAKPFTMQILLQRVNQALGHPERTLVHGASSSAA